MKIKTIHITEFGALRDFSLEFSDSLNIITGDNESGKSTILLFITYMLYGIAKKGAHASVDKARSISWENSRAAGHMDVEKDGKLYRITRALKGKTSSSKVSIFELESGEELEGALPADLFLEGISRETFESCCLCGQLRSSSIHGTDVAESLSNLSLSADQSVNAAEVINTVRSARKEYKHERGKGGLIDEINDEIEALLAEKLLAERSYEKLTLDREALEIKKGEHALAKTKLEIAEKKKESLAAAQLLARFEVLRNTEKELDEQNNSLETLRLDSGFGELEPSEAELAELRHIKREYENSLDRLQLLESSPAHTPAKIDYRAKAFAESITALGGKDAYLSSYESELRSVKKLRTVGTVCAVLGTLSVVCAVFMTAMIAIGIVFAVSAALCFVFGAKKKTSLEAKYSDLHTSGMTANEYIQYAYAQLEIFLKEEEIKAKSERETAVAREQLEGVKKLICEKLQKRSRSENTYEGLSALISDIAVYIEKREGTKQRISVLSEMLKQRERELEGYDENTLKASVLSEHTSGLSATSVNEEYRKALSDEKRLSDELTELIIRTESSKVNEKTLAELTEKLSEAESKKSVYSERYEIYDLALRSLESAKDNLQNNFAPEIRRRAGEILSRISSGKYDRLFLSKDLGVSVEGGALPRSAEILSGGTSDAVYVALRLALTENIFESNVPVFLDETLSQVDDKRAKSILELVSDFVNNGNQCLLFTCHKREAELCDESGIGYDLIRI